MKIQVKLLKWSSFKSKIKKTKVNSSITVFDVFRRYFRVFPKVKFSNKNEVFVKLLTVFFFLYEVTVSFHELSKGRPLIWIFFQNEYNQRWDCKRVIHWLPSGSLAITVELRSTPPFLSSTPLFKQKTRGKEKLNSIFDSVWTWEW